MRLCVALLVHSHPNTHRYPDIPIRNTTTPTPEHDSPLHIQTIPANRQKPSSSSPKSHFRAVNFLPLTLGVLATPGALDSKLNPTSLNPTFSASLLSIAIPLGFRGFDLVGERHCSSRSMASSLRRRASFWDSRSAMWSSGWGPGSSWTAGGVLE